MLFNCPKPSAVATNDYPHFMDGEIERLSYPSDSTALEFCHPALLPLLLPWSDSKISPCSFQWLQGRRPRCPARRQGPRNLAFLLPPSLPAQLPTWNTALSKKAQERSQMLTHLPDTGMRQPRRLRARVGGVGGVAHRPVVRPGARGAASKSWAFFPECSGFQRLKRSRWACPLPLPLHP